MAGSRGDTGMSDGSVRQILEHGATSPSMKVVGRNITTLDDLGQVITESDGTIMNVIPAGRQSGPEFQGWLVKVLIAMLAE
jgi:hypothetical protein